MSFSEILLTLVRNIPGMSGIINRYATNQICQATHARPRPYSLWSHIAKPEPQNPAVQGPPGEYTTWPMLTDRKYSARHIGPARHDYINQLPEDTPYSEDSPGQVTELFARADKMIPSRSSALFMFFAQWFTDSVLRVHPIDRRMNTSNHNIDLCQIYGLEETTARLLRSGKNGRLRSQQREDGEYLDYLGEVDNSGKWAPKHIYKDLPYVRDGRIYKIMEEWPDRWDKLYATGLERGNSSIGYVGISTLFMREHNRICQNLASANSSWDDERLFQTARMINTAILMKLIVVDYINHIAGLDIFVFDPDFAERQDWYRTPWISLEFDLLYRWHSLVPDYLMFGDDKIDQHDYRVNNSLFERVGLEQVIDLASKNRAGEISLSNVPHFLLPAEYQMIKMGRDFRLAPYNEYRKRFGLDRVSSFEELTDNQSLRKELKSLYGNINKLEFIVGLFAEKRTNDRLFGDLMYAMVAYDAFTQIYTNPLLSQNVYNKQTLTSYGVNLIDNTNSVQDLVRRNTRKEIKVKASFGKR